MKSAAHCPPSMGVYVRIRSAANGDDGNGDDCDGDDGNGDDGNGVGDGDHSISSTLTSRLATTTFTSLLPQI